MPLARHNGFTLVELVITIAIIGVLAGMAAPMLEMSIRRNKERELKDALMTIRSAIDAYKDAVDSGHVLRNSDESGYPRDLSLLTSGVQDQKSPSGSMLYLLRRIPRDPFASEGAKSEETWGLRSYSSPSDAPQAGRDVFDVYSLAQGIGLNGVPYSQW